MNQNTITRSQLIYTGKGKNTKCMTSIGTDSYLSLCIREKNAIQHYLGTDGKYNGQKSENRKKELQAATAEYRNQYRDIVLSRKHTSQGYQYPDVQEMTDTIRIMKLCNKTINSINQFKN